MSASEKDDKNSKTTAREKFFHKLLSWKGRRGGFAPIDFGVLKVAMTLAAIDGSVIEHEIGMFKRLAKRCNGWTEEVAELALRDGLHSAGYMIIQSKRLPERNLVSEFVNEAIAILPKKFNRSAIYHLRRAFIIWIFMARADRKVHLTEYKAILALRKKLELDEKIPDRFLRGVLQQFQLLQDENFSTNAFTTIGSFIDLD